MDKKNVKLESINVHIENEVLTLTSEHPFSEHNVNKKIPSNNLSTWSMFKNNKNNW